MTLARVSLTLCLAFLHVPLYHPYITFGLHILYLETKKHVCLCSCCRSSGLIIFTADETLCQTCGFHSSPGFCLLSLLFLNDAIGGKRQAFWKNISPAYQFFFFFFPNCAFGVLSDNPLFNSWSQRFPLVFSSKGFTFSV